MKSLYTIISLFLFSSSFGQDMSDFKREMKKEDCVYIPKYSKQQRLATYPFSVADSIIIISFKHYYICNYPVKGDTIAKDEVLESKTLSHTQILQFTDILYNNFQKAKSKYGVLSQCFAPRNAVVFFDSLGKVKETFLVCFECDKVKAMNGSPVFKANVCNQMMDKIRRFFRANGIKYGTDPNVTEYPGEEHGPKPFYAPPPSDTLLPVKNSP